MLLHKLGYVAIWENKGGAVWHRINSWLFYAVHRGTNGVCSQFPMSEKI